MNPRFYVALGLLILPAGCAHVRPSADSVTGAYTVEWKRNEGLWVTLMPDGTYRRMLHYYSWPTNDESATWQGCIDAETGKWEMVDGTIHLAPEPKAKGEGESEDRCFERFSVFVASASHGATILVGNDGRISIRLEKLPNKPAGSTASAGTSAAGQPRVPVAPSSGAAGR